MNTDLISAATHLADTLAEENAALAALDLARAAAMLPRKQQAVAAFTTALTSGGATEPLAQRLRALADENKSLLERAIAAQRRVIARLRARCRAATTLRCIARSLLRQPASPIRVSRPGLSYRPR